MTTKVPLSMIDPEVISVTRFGADPSGLLDSTAALLAARNFMASAPLPKPALVFPAGVYLYTESPNWNIDNLEVRALGNVYLRNTGAGPAILIDGGAGLNDRVFNPCWGAVGNFILQGAAGSGDGIRVRSAIHGDIRAKVYGAGGAGLRSEGCVLVRFAVTVTPGEENGTAWYDNAVPGAGIVLEDKGIANTQTAYCQFDNCSAQAVPIGAYVDGALGNVFLGGDFEWCSDTGLDVTANAVNNRFIGVDLEVNTNADLNCGGSYNEFIGCDSNTLVLFASGAKNNLMLGGSHQSITLSSGAADNVLSGVKYNRGLSGGVITDAAARTRYRDIMNVGTGQVGDAPKSVTTISVGASPFVYTNNTGNPIRLAVQGGTVGNLTLYQGSESQVLNYPTGLIPLLPGEGVSVAYTAAPTMKVFRG